MWVILGGLGIILSGWRWVGHYFGWVGVDGTLFWVGRGESGCLHCLIMPNITVLSIDVASI